MDVVTLILFVTLEVVMLLGIALVFLRRQNKQLQKRLSELEAQPAADPQGFASVESGYLPYLEQQIIETRAHFESIEGVADEDNTLPDALRYRLDFMEAEKKVTELCNDYPQDRWQHVAEHFQPPAQEQETPAQDEETPSQEIQIQVSDVQPESGGMEELQGLLGQQGDSIQSLREVIMQVKADPRAEMIDQLEEKLTELERRYREANTCMEIMDQENTRLQDKVERKDQHLDRVKKENNESVNDLEEQLGKQKHSISELHHMLDELQLEAGKATELQEKLAQFDLASRDMNMCIQVLEEENEFLQEQVRGLLQMEDGDSVYQKEELEKKLMAVEARVEELSASLAEKELQLQQLETQQDVSTPA